tara:strand:- start:690 stop:2711 length:2022 start_codon:yes stop_codon:yes gene_type:complete
MKNLFSKKNYKKFSAEYKKNSIPDELIERVYTSRLLGSDPNLVLHGGGNTSVKSVCKDSDGESHKVIYVKGSGWDLSNIEPNGFSAIKITPLIKLLNKENVSDEEMVNFTKKNLIDLSSPNPSVETLVHAIIKDKFVDHTHSNAILEICNRPNGKKLCKDIFGEEFLFVPYVMPGYLLAKKVFELYKEDLNVKGMILYRHGIFTFGDTSEKSYTRMINAVSKAERYIKKQEKNKIVQIKRKKINFSSDEIAPLLRGYLCKRKNYILNFRSSKKILSDINNKNLKSILNRGVITPDHVIRTKPFPMVLNIDNCKSLKMLNKILKNQFKIYCQNYTKYFDDNVKNNKTSILDSIPQIIIVQNLGIFSVGKSLNEAKINGDVSEMSIRTIGKIEENSKFQSIKNQDIFDVEYWSLEQAKIKKNSNSMVGKVVLVTGGAGTIGLATANKFKQNGAEVIILDNDRKKIKDLKILNTFESLYCDVTNRNSFKKAMKKICSTYGGIDILVSNAGIATQSEMINISDKDLLESFNINFFSHHIVASESVKIMKTQDKGGCLLFNISKQSVNPGMNFGSYGTSKAALLALCKQYALEYGKYKIRSNGVNADRIKSGLLTDKMIEKRSKSRNISIENYLKGNLLNTQVFAEDVAEAFYSLSNSEKTTAAILTVDGGNIEASMR